MVHFLICIIIALTLLAFVLYTKLKYWKIKNSLTEKDYLDLLLRSREFCKVITDDWECYDIFLKDKIKPSLYSVADHCADRLKKLENQDLKEYWCFDNAMYDIRHVREATWWRKLIGKPNLFIAECKAKNIKEAYKKFTEQGITF